jgi:modulator of FtsH protease HflK
MIPEAGRKNEDGGTKALKDALKSTAILLKVAMLLLLVAFIFSCFKNLTQFEKAIVLRFGALEGPVRDKPGVLFVLPYPIDHVITVPAGRTQSLTSTSFMFQKTAMNEINPALKPGVDGYLLTADGNILHCESTLKYQVEDLNEFVFSVSEKKMDEFLRNMLDNAVLKSAATLTLTEVLDKKMLISESSLLLQKSLDDMGLGVKVELLDLRVSVPRQVEEDRLEVTKAMQDASRFQSEAEIYVRKSRDTSESEAVQVESTAEVWKTRMMSRAEADFKTFKQLLEKYRNDPEQVKSMLLRDAMMEISPSLDEVFVFDNKSDRELRIIMPRKSPNPTTKESK